MSDRMAERPDQDAERRNKNRHCHSSAHFVAAPAQHCDNMQFSLVLRVSASDMIVVYLQPCYHLTPQSIGQSGGCESAETGRQERQPRLHRKSAADQAITLEQLRDLVKIRPDDPAIGAQIMGVRGVMRRLHSVAFGDLRSKPRSSIC
eukprot:3252732-Amphidinium_carterae.2